MKRSSFIIVLLFINASLSFAQEGTLKAYKPCDPQHIFAVDYNIIREKFDQKYKFPARIPQYDGDSWDLKMYFTSKNLQNTSINGVATRIQIAFVIDCNGGLGEFQVINNIDEKSRALANELIGICREMPNKWIPARHKNVNVDCFQVISFMIYNKDITNVFWKE